MPIYEFYCKDCHTIFNFLSAKVDTTTKPSCPKCGLHPLERQVSRFAISKGLPDPSEARGGSPDEPLSPQDFGHRGSLYFSSVSSPAIFLSLSFLSPATASRRSRPR